MKKELEDFKKRCDMVKVVSHYVLLEKSGSSYRGLCPFHEEKTPSFYVHPDRGFFHCFGCGAGGDVIEFVKKIENLSFVESVQKVASMCDIEPPSMATDRDFVRYTGLMEAITESYKNVLFSARGTQALGYLSKERNLDRESIERFGLGYAPVNSDVVVMTARKMGVPTEELLKYRLLVRSKSGRLYEFFRDRVVFPIMNSSGRTIAFGGRIISETGPKYINSSENRYFSKSKTLYLFNRARQKMRESGFAIICEGYMDAIAFHRNGFENACALLGTNLTKSHLSALKSATTNLLLVLDSDTAGLSAMEKVAKTLVGEDFNVKVILFPNAKDPDEFFTRFGRENFRKILVEALDYWDFYVQKALGETNDPIKAVGRFGEAVRWIDSPMLKKKLIGKASKILMIDEKEIMYELQSKKRSESESVQNQKEENARVVSVPSGSRRMNVDDYVVYLLFLGEDSRSKIVGRLDPKFLSPFARKAFEIVSSGTVLPQEALKIFGNEDGKKFFQIFTRDLNLDVDRTVEFCIGEIEKRKIKFRIDELEREMISTTDRELRNDLKKKAMELRSKMMNPRKRGASNGKN